MRAASIGLLGRILLILAFVMATEFIANTLIFERVGQFALQDDDARRMAEHLVVAHRILDRTAPAARPTVARELSTARFSMQWHRVGRVSAASYGLHSLREQMLEFEPELLGTKLNLHLRSLRNGGDIAGSMELADRSTMSFQTSQAKIIWPLTFGRILGIVAPTLVLVLIGGLMIRATLKPLRVLLRATHQVGTREPEPVPETGPTEVRSLIHSFNAMQMRIHRLITTRTRALAAVGHDLRTPLARLELRLGSAKIDDETRRAMSEDLDEMGDLLRSLQVFLSGEGQSLPPERIDLAAMISTLIDTARDAGKDAFYYGPSSLEATVRPVGIRRSVSNLIENALHYGSNVRVSLEIATDAILIIVDDDGPGIPEDKMADVLQPFVRLNIARSRNTRGMGLGLAIVQEAVRTEGGELTLANRIEGGLRATIRLPGGPA